MSIPLILQLQRACLFCQALQLLFLKRPLTLITCWKRKFVGRINEVLETNCFISIDCGKEAEPVPSDYDSDAVFINTGENFLISPEYFRTVSGSIYETVRSFPSGDRNCYTLKPSKGRDINYLIRAQFMYGNYDQENRIPIFNIYLGVDFWSTMSLSTVTTRSFLEMIYKPTTDFIHICLVNIGQGTPFISGLFLRPLSSSIYNSGPGSLSMVYRYNTGSFISGEAESYFSYPNDPYDRFWTSVPASSFPSLRPYKTSIELETLINDAYKIPPSMLSSGATTFLGNRSFRVATTPIRPTDVYYYYWHFAETEKLGEYDLREFNIFMSGGNHLGPFRPKYMEALTVVSPPLTLPSGDARFWFSINQTNASTLPPILSAFEVYSYVNISHAATNQDDVKAIMDVKTKYNTITGWQGDPCLPKFPWEGLKCSNNSSIHPRITSLNLSSYGLTGEILPSISGLTALDYLNLSYNALIGKIPEFLADMSSLQVIDLSGNKLSGSIPVKLTERVKRGSVSLSLNGNPDICLLDSCAIRGHRKNQKFFAPLLASAGLLLLLIILVVVFYTYRWKRKAAGTSSMKLENRAFTYSEVVNMTNNFQNIIGNGGSGTVYHGRLQDGTLVAVKILNPSSTLSFKLFRTEAELLTRIHHKNLVSLVGYCEEGENMALIYEFVANGNLHEHLSEKNVKISGWKVRLQMAIDAAQDRFLLILRVLYLPM
ncbi:hypothetical protein BVRB_9g211940 isoform B [Beta vulgaris subsp. vulgaris]|nr:hypothetical protein BVRB_9g211940 isoform B [Beta vulgaris subsp. vulgaris]